MIGDHVHQKITFYDGKDGELRVKFDDGAAEGRMIVDRIATDDDKKAQSPAYAAYLRAKAKT